MDSLSEIISLLRTGSAPVRAGAARAIAGLTGSADGLELLTSPGVIAALSAAVGSEEAVAEPCVKALINLSAHPSSRSLVASRASLAVALMECARDPQCLYARACVALLSNISATEEGIDSIFQTGDARAGLQLRRLLPLLAVPKTPELLGVIFANMSRSSEVRKMLLDPERLLLPAFFSQLTVSESIERRRAAANTLRNCAFENDPRTIEFLLSPAVDFVTALVTPLARPAHYDEAEREGMPLVLANAASNKETEPDAIVRRSLVEALLIFAQGSRTARSSMREKKVYYVLRGFHWWLEGISESEKEEEGADSRRGVLVRALTEREMDEESGAGLSEDDEATVEAINALVQQLWREDEVPLGAKEPMAQSKLGGSVVGGAKSRALDGLSGTATEDAARRADDIERREAISRLAASASDKKGTMSAVIAAEARMNRFATRSIEEARSIARQVATGELHAGSDDIE